MSVDVGDKGVDIYKFRVIWPMYSLAWSHRQDGALRIAGGTFVDDDVNKVCVIVLRDARDAHLPYDRRFEVLYEMDHPYPPTKVAFVPDPHCTRPDLLATSGDFLRIWELEGGRKVKNTCKLKKNRSDDHCAPLTSFDWNEEDPSLVGTSSIDTTCTVWNIETQQAKTQLIAHDREVYDFAFGEGTNVFGSVGADGSVRLFDLRNLEHSTVIYESADLAPLTRLIWNKRDPNYLATLKIESPTVIVLDIRYPTEPVLELEELDVQGAKSINAIAWAPHSSTHLCAVGESGRASVWDLSAHPRPIEAPILSYDAERAIDNVQWSTAAPDWIAIATRKDIQALRV